MELHRRKFLQTQGPVARRGFRPATQILRAENVLPSPKGNSRNRGPGADSPCQGEMSRSDRGGRVGEYGHAVSILSRPPAILKVNCPEGAREGGLGHWFLSHRWERNSPRRATPPAYNNPNPKPAPSSVTASPCHLPPRGKAYDGRRRNSIKTQEYDYELECKQRI